MFTQSSKSVWILSILFFAGLFSCKAFAQDSSKVIKSIKCSHGDCSIEVQGNDVKELKLIFKSHMLLMHNVDLSDEQIDKLITDGPAADNNPELKSITCPHNDGFKIMSKNEKELLFWFNGHVEIWHNETLTEAEIKKLIK